MKKLSLLILSLEQRKTFLARLLSILIPQLNDSVEIIIESDSGETSIGEKRNKAISKSTGDYICFIDDDDLVSGDYVEKILSSLSGSPDCVGISLLHFNDNILAGLTYHSISYTNWFESRENVIGLMRYYRNPNHLNPVKRNLAVLCPFPNKSMGEDKDYSMALLSLLKTEVYIKEPIYYYMFRSNKE